MLSGIGSLIPVVATVAALAVVHAAGVIVKKQVTKIKDAQARAAAAGDSASTSPAPTPSEDGQQGRRMPVKREEHFE